MAESGTIFNRDGAAAEIDEDDPLMELSRIIGLEPRRETISRYAPAPNSGREMVSDAVEVPAAPSAADTLQKDLAEELIASLGSDDDFADADAASEVVSLAESAPASPVWKDARFEADAVHETASGFGERSSTPESAPRISAPEPGSLEAELESILGDPAPPLGLRPDFEDELQAPEAKADDQLAAVADQPLRSWEDTDIDAEPALEMSAQGPEFVSDSIAEHTPFDDGVEQLGSMEPEIVTEAQGAAEPARAEASDFWRRSSFRAGGESAPRAPEEPLPSVHEPRFEESFAPKHAAAATEPLTPEAGPSAFEPLVDAVTHEPRGVELTGELEVPEFEYAADEGKPLAAEALEDEFDAEYSPSYRQSAVAPAYAPPAEAEARYASGGMDQLDNVVDELEDERNYGAAAIAAAAGGAAHQRSQQKREFVLDEEDGFGASLDVPQAPATVKPSAGRSYLIAAGLGALALLGGIGAYALTRPGDTAQTAADAPVVLKADTAPVKIAPETPGGKVVPNQDIAVFDKTAGDAPPKTVQTELVSKSQAPVDLTEKAAPRVVLPGPAKAAAPEAPALAEAPAAPPAAKSEERVAEQPADDASLVKAEVASVSPKKVRTMVVKADGSLEERAASPEPAPGPVKTALAAPADSAVPAKKVQTSAVLPDEAVGAVTKAEAAAPDAAVSPDAAPEAVAEAPPAAAQPKPVVKTVKAKKAQQKAAAKAEAEVLKEVAAANIPLVDGRPSDQPVTIVAKTGKTPQPSEEVVALATAPEPSSGGNYVIQIASAPSADAAQATYASLSRKFGNVIGGKNMRIQKADIPGKGTFYRVRIAAGSKKDAAALCARYKSAGGQCLVAK